MRPSVFSGLGAASANGARLSRFAAALLLGAAGIAAVPAVLAEEATDPAPEAIERQELAAKRREIEARHDARERECAERFAVTTCLEANRDQRRAATAELNARLAALDDRQRARRAEVRQRRIDAKVARQAEPPPQQGASAPVVPLALPVEASR